MTTALNPAITASRGMHVALWVAQVALGLAFAAAGGMKLTQPIAALATSIGWPGTVPAALVRFIGAAELLGGLGLIIPSATRIQAGLTPLAGAGLATIMVLAALFHISRGEWSALPINIVLGGLSALVAWGRASKVPIAPR